MSSPWDKPRLIEMAYRERDSQDIKDIDALMHFCQTQFKGPRHAAPVFFTVFCTILGELYEKGELSDRALKHQGPMLRDSVKLIAKALRKQSK